MFVWKYKINEKEAENGQFLKKKHNLDEMLIFYMRHKKVNVCQDLNSTQFEWLFHGRECNLC